MESIHLENRRPGLLMQNYSVFRFALYLALIAYGVNVPAQAEAFSLKGTMWERGAVNAPCKLDPLLLYAVALKESRGSAGSGLISPQPYALRNGPSGNVYPKSLGEARILLRRYLAEDNLTDIGIMQINYRWNGNRVRKPEDLLEPEVNIKTGSKILCESIALNPSDIQLAIGGYHTMNPTRELDARSYAADVIGIWRSIQRLNAQGKE